MFEDFFQDFFGQGIGQSFGLGKIKLQMVSTSPAGIVKITDMAQVELPIGSYGNNPRAEYSHCHVEDLVGSKTLLPK